MLLASMEGKNSEQRAEEMATMTAEKGGGRRENALTLPARLASNSFERALALLPPQITSPHSQLVAATRFLVAIALVAVWH